MNERKLVKGQAFSKWRNRL